MRGVWNGFFAVLQSLIAAGMVLGSSSQSLGQNSERPMVGPRPLEAAAGRVGRVEFEVVSVRLNEHWKYTDPGYSLDADEAYRPDPGLFVADAPVAVLIAFAYKLDLQNSLIANLPKWARDQSFAIRARVPGTPTKDQVRLMMQTFLADRLKLSLHFEEQEKPAFALTLMAPGKLGPWLHMHGEEDCKVSGTVPKADGKVEGLSWLPCGVYLALDRADGGIFAAARNTTMRGLCAFLSNVGGFGRPVVDATGMTGAIDFGMEYTKPKTDTPADGASLPGETLVGALHDQLRLKLVPVRAVLDIPVVDHLEMPTQD